MNVNSNNPLYVKIKHKTETFIIFSDEYNKSDQLKSEIGRIKEIAAENIRLFYSNKRMIEDNVTNHDQQIKHTTLLYATLRNPETGEWENINEIINFNPEAIINI